MNPYGEPIGIPLPTVDARCIAHAPAARIFGSYRGLPARERHEQTDGNTAQIVLDPRRRAGDYSSNYRAKRERGDDVQGIVLKGRSKPGG